jgi:Ca2+-binding EF-hand superfamily protein
MDSHERHDPTDPRLAELREAFRRCDADRDDSIGLDEFARLLDDLGAGMSAREVRIGFQEIDTDDDQRISFREFVAWWCED